MLLYSMTQETTGRLETIGQYLELIKDWLWEENVNADLIQSMPDTAESINQGNTVFKADNDVSRAVNEIVDHVEYCNYSEKGIIGCKYTKTYKSVWEWITEVILDTVNSEITVRLIKKVEGTKYDSQEFRVPQIVNMMMRKGMLEADHGFAVTDLPINVTEKNVDTVAKILTRTIKCDIPVVYISYSWNEDGYVIDVDKLADELAGRAIVLTEEDSTISGLIKPLANGRNPYNESMAIYFPGTDSGSHITWIKSNSFGSSDEGYAIVITAIQNYASQRKVNSLYTYDGLYAEKTNDANTKLSKKNESVVNENNELYATYDKQLNEADITIQQLMNKVKQLETENDMLNAELNGIRDKRNSSSSLLYRGSETEKYYGEAKDLIVCSLNDYCRYIPEGSRRHHLIDDIIRANDGEQCIEHVKERHNSVKAIIQDLSAVNAEQKRELSELGFVVDDDGKHCKLKYFGDGRYTHILPKTGSDVRNGKNNAAQIIKDFM